MANNTLFILCLTFETVLVLSAGFLRLCILSWWHFPLSAMNLLLWQDFVHVNNRLRLTNRPPWCTLPVCPGGGITRKCKHPVFLEEGKTIKINRCVCTQRQCLSLFKLLCYQALCGWLLFSRVKWVGANFPGKVGVCLLDMLDILLCLDSLSSEEVFLPSLEASKWILFDCQPSWWEDTGKCWETTRHVIIIKNKFRHYPLKIELHACTNESLMLEVWWC